MKPSPPVVSPAQISLLSSCLVFPAAYSNPNGGSRLKSSSPATSSSYNSLSKKMTLPHTQLLKPNLQVFLVSCASTPHLLNNHLQNLSPSISSQPHWHWYGLSNQHPTLNDNYIHPNGCLVPSLTIAPIHPLSCRGLFLKHKSDRVSPSTSKLSVAFYSPLDHFRFQTPEQGLQLTGPPVHPSRPISRHFPLKARPFSMLQMHHTCLISSPSLGCVETLPPGAPSSPEAEWLSKPMNEYVRSCLYSVD